jgi:spermidine/putrescine transport system permease protein
VSFVLALILSIDDFVITNFNSGTTVTFPLYVWGAARVGVPPQVNVIGSMLFLVAIAVLLPTLRSGGRGRAR